MKKIKPGGIYSTDSGDYMIPLRLNKDIKGYDACSIYTGFYKDVDYGKLIRPITCIKDLKAVKGLSLTFVVVPDYYYDLEFNYGYCGKVTDILFVELVEELVKRYG